MNVVLDIVLIQSMGAFGAVLATSASMLCAIGWAISPESLSLAFPLLEAAHPGLKALLPDSSPSFRAPAALAIRHFL